MTSWSLNNVNPGRELYLAPNFEGLQEMGKVKTPPVDKVVLTLSELEKRANLARIEGDHEMAYVYLMRYILIAMDVRKRVKVDEENLRKMFDLAETLSVSLRKRYVERDSPTKPSEESSTQENNNSNKESKSDGKSNKKAVDCSSPAAQESIWINSKQLYQLMRQLRSADNLLIMDCRSSKDFASAHIDFPGSLNISEEILVPGMAASKLERAFPTDSSSARLFQKRNVAKNIVLVDWDSGEDGGRYLADTKSPIWCLYLALTKWNVGTLGAQPKLLMKGFNDFLLHYPQIMTSKVSPSKASKRLQDQFDDLYRGPLQMKNDYPDIDKIWGVKKTKEPERPAKPASILSAMVSPLPKMTIPQIDRSKKPSLLSAANKVLHPSVPTIASTITTVEPTPGPAHTPVVVQPSPSVEEAESREKQRQVVDQLDTSVRDALQAEIRELEARKKEQLVDLAEVMRQNRHHKATAQKPAMPSSSQPLIQVEPVEPTPEPPKHQTSHRPRARSVSPKGDKKVVEPVVVPISQPNVDRSKKPMPTIASVINNNESQNNVRPVVPPKTHSQSTSSISSQLSALPFTDNSADVNSLQPVYGPTPSGVSGLRNLGNTCFLASIVQCLAAAPAFSDFYVYSAYKAAVHRRQKMLLASDWFDPNTYRQPIATVEMGRILKAMLSGQYRSLAPRGLKAVIGDKSATFATSKQQDAQEFLAELLDTLHEELNCGEKMIEKERNYQTAKSDALEEEPTSMQAAWDQHRRHHNSVLVDLFHGLLASTVTCLGCRKVYPKFDAFVYLTLPVPTGDDRGKITMHDCLAAYVYPEEVDGWRCSNCKRPSRVLKKLDVVHPPAILIVHLNRFAWSGEWRAKITDPVHFEVDNFRLGTRSYSLFAVCNHFGTLEAGHYTATTRPSSSLGRQSATFFKYDDAEVSALSSHALVADERHSSAAYLLFYAANDVDWAQYRRDLVRTAAKL